MVADLREMQENQWVPENQIDKLRFVVYIISKSMKGSNPTMWVGGIVGLKSILGVRRRDIALNVIQQLERYGFLSWSLAPSTKKLSYTLSDWFVRFSGAECPDGAVYTTEGYGFVCVSREITQRLVEHNYKFEESDAWLDLWLDLLTL